MTTRYDVAVIGLGALGSATVWELSRRGLSTIGIEQFSAPTPLGSTHGRTRLFRRACLEHPALSEYALVAQNRFRLLEQLTGTTLLDLTGGITIGHHASASVTGSLAAARRIGHEPEILDAAELADRYPQHAELGHDDVGVVDPGAGIAYPERFVGAAISAARDAGTHIVEGVRVTGIRPRQGWVEIDTPTTTWTADTVVVCAGAWIPRFAPQLPLAPIRTPMTWFTGGIDHTVQQLGIFIREITPTHVLWGHGHTGDRALKLGLGDIGVERTRIDPDSFDRGVSAADSRAVVDTVARFLPGVDPVPHRVDPCMITRTPDGQFVIGAVSPRVMIAGGDSGHAFKHAPAIGALVADLVLDSASDLEHGFVAPGRFT